MLESFYSKLENVKSKMPSIRWSLVGLDKDQIRGQLDIASDSKPLLFCPLTAICYNETGKYYSIIYPQYAASELNFSTICRDIINASDNNENHDEEIANRLMEILEL